MCLTIQDKPVIKFDFLKIPQIREICKCLSILNIIKITKVAICLIGISLRKKSL